ncbi:MAG: 6-bladed beta-propeller [Candidatus Sabulitectum sp.]|nr:6-bladed beta-propeller [Candidatus Sabulitectum sp.]
MRHLILSVALLLAAGCGKVQPQTAGDETYQPAVETRTMLKTDSMGVELGDSTEVFGAIEGLVTGPDGNIAVLDRAACCIRIFTSEGEFLRQISREGNGPGELISAAFLTITEDGTLILTGDGSETLGIHAFDYFTGEWITSEPSYGSPPTCLEGAGGRTYMRKSLDIDVSTGEPVIVVQITLNEIGAEEPLVVFLEERIPFKEDMSAIISLVWFGYDLACDFSDGFYVSPRSTEEAVVYAYNETGAELFSIELDLEPVLRNEAELESERLVLVAKAIAMDNAEAASSLEADPYKPLIRGLEVDCDGNLWVLLGGSSQPAFEVFNSSGEYLYRVVLEGEQTDGHSWKFNFSNDNILAYADDPAEGFQKIWLLEVE